MSTNNGFYATTTVPKQGTQCKAVVLQNGKKLHGRQPSESLTTLREDFMIPFVSMQTLTFSLCCTQEQNQTQTQNHCWRKRKQFLFQWEFDFESAQ